MNGGRSCRGDAYGLRSPIQQRVDIHCSSVAANPRHRQRSIAYAAQSSSLQGVFSGAPLEHSRAHKGGKASFTSVCIFQLRGNVQSLQDADLFVSPWAQGGVEVLLDLDSSCAWRGLAQLALCCTYFQVRHRRQSPTFLCSSRERPSISKKLPVRRELMYVRRGNACHICLYCQGPEIRVPFNQPTNLANMLSSSNSEHTRTAGQRTTSTYLSGPPIRAKDAHDRPFALMRNHLLGLPEKYRPSPEI